MTDIPIIAESDVIPQPVYIIETQGDDLNWQMILTRLLKDAELERQDVLVTILGNKVSYAVRKGFVTPEAIAAALGTTPELVEKAQKLVLKPLTGDKDWPKSTVSYVGAA